MKTGVIISVCAVAMCATPQSHAVATAHPPTHATGKVKRAVSASPGSVSLFEQNDDANGVAILSSTDDDEWSAYSSYGADDFAVPAGHKWKITEVDVTGIYVNGSGPAYSENVLFFKNKNGLPGRPVAECDGVVGKDNGVSFAIKLPKSCRVALKGSNTYWVSVVANLTWDVYGIWEWETRNGQNGNPATWENPGGGFGFCSDWGVMTSCIGNYGEGPDFMFELKGKDALQ